MQLDSNAPAPSGTGDRPGVWSTRRPYVVFALVLFALLTVQTLNRQWSSDFWWHRAAVEALQEDLVHPGHERTGADDPSPNFTPYTVTLAASARVTGADTVHVLQFAALANLVLFLVAFELFVTELTGRRAVAFFALLATLVLWGIDPWRWSGFLNLNSIGFGLPYPSMFATGLALLVAWMLLRYDDTGTRWWLVGIGFGLATVLLSHPFTGGWASIMFLALFIHREMYRRERLVPLLVTGAAGLTLVAAWPYYSLFDLGGVGDLYAGSRMYTRVPLRLLASIPGFAVIVQRFRRDRTDPLALMLIGALIVYATGAIVDNGNFGRVMPLVLLPVHIALGIFLADIVERRIRVGVPIIVWLAASFMIGIVGVAPAFARMVPHAVLPEALRDRRSLQPLTEPYEPLEGALAPGTVAVAETDQLAVVAPAYGIRLVDPRGDSAFVHDLRQRERDAERFLDASTSERDREAIADRYHVKAVICATDRCARAFDTSTVIARGPGWTLLRVPVL